ncbi:hypothetical protein HAX54_034608, partial [Datura stramonium]|nr:hypothetical protein [Datura stramonium]
MVLTRIGTANKANTAASNAALGGHPTFDHTTIAANFEVGTGNVNQASPQAPSVSTGIAIDIRSIQSTIQMLTTLEIGQHEHANTSCASVAERGKVKHFLSLNPSKFYDSHMEDDLQYFIDDTFKALKLSIPMISKLKAKLERFTCGSRTHGKEVPATTAMSSTYTFASLAGFAERRENCNNKGGV